MTTDYFWLLMAKENLRPLQEKFYEMGGFYNGIGYAFHSKNREFLKQIVSKLPEAKIVKIPIGAGESFDSIRQAYKASYFREKLIEIDQDILTLRTTYRLEELSEEEIKRSPLSLDKKEFLLELIHEKEKLQKSMAWAEGMEKALVLQKSPFQGIKFISEREVNLLLVEAPEMPRLINYNDGNLIKPLIRKGIVGMLVGAGGVGKTHALVQLAISICTGSPWLGKFPIERIGAVFMALGENTEEDIHRLLRKIVIGLSKKKQQFLFFDEGQLREASKRLSIMSVTGSDASFVHQGKETVFFETFLSELKTKEPEEGWSCIILDPISRFLGADAETDNASATRFISLLERVVLELKGKPTVLFGHHMNKSGIGSKNTDQAAARGSSAITDGVRWQANLERVRKKDAKDDADDAYEFNQIMLRTVKSNFTVILPALRLQKDQNGCLIAEEDLKTRKNEN